MAAQDERAMSMSLVLVMSSDACTVEYKESEELQVAAIEKWKLLVGDS